MATFIAGNNTTIIGNTVADNIDNRSYVFGSDRGFDAEQISAILRGLAATGTPVGGLTDLAEEMKRSGGPGRTPQTRAFLEGLTRVVAHGGETLRTLPGVKVLIDFLSAFFR